VVDRLPVDVQHQRRQRVLRVRAFGRAAGALQPVGTEPTDAVAPGRVRVVELAQCLGSCAGVREAVRVARRAAEVRTATFPAAGGLSPETLTYNYDPTLGQPTTLNTTYGGVAGKYVMSTTFSELGQLLQTRFSTGTGGSVYQDFTYEVDANLLHEASVSRTSVTPNVVSDITYDYDASGNITKETDAPAGGATDTQCFQQDYLGRLSEAWTPSSGSCATAPSVAGLGGPAPYWQSYTYDAVGNRRTMVDHATAAGEATTTYAVP
jgi:hypothetical protein